MGLRAGFSYFSLLSPGKQENPRGMTLIINRTCHIATCAREKNWKSGCLAKHIATLNPSGLHQQEKGIDTRLWSTCLPEVAGRGGGEGGTLNPLLMLGSKRPEDSENLAKSQLLFTLLGTKIFAVPKGQPNANDPRPLLRKDTWWEKLWCPPLLVGR